MKKKAVNKPGLTIAWRIARAKPMAETRALTEAINVLAVVDHRLDATGVSLG